MSRDEKTKPRQCSNCGVDLREGETGHYMPTCMVGMWTCETINKFNAEPESVEPSKPSAPQAPPQAAPPLEEQVHAVMSARVEDAGMNFYAPDPSGVAPQAEAPTEPTRILVETDAWMDTRAVVPHSEMSNEAKQHVCPMGGYCSICEAEAPTQQFTQGAQGPLSSPAIYWWTCRLCGTATAGESAPSSRVCENHNGCNEAEAPRGDQPTLDWYKGPRRYFEDACWIRFAEADDAVVKLLEANSAPSNIEQEAREFYDGYNDLEFNTRRDVEKFAAAFHRHMLSKEK